MVSGLLRWRDHSKTAPAAYFWSMPKFEFCFSTIDKIVPAGADWFREIRYDANRVQPSYAQADY
jgi:hypothetical protein